MLLPLDERQPTQVFVAKPQQVECIERNLGLSAHQRPELTLAFSVEADDFTVQDRRCVQLRKGLTQGCERFVLVVLAGDERTRVVANVSQRTEAVMLDLEQPVWVVERSGYKGQLHRNDARKFSHLDILSSGGRA